MTFLYNTLIICEISEMGSICVLLHKCGNNCNEERFWYCINMIKIDFFSNFNLHVYISFGYVIFTIIL